MENATEARINASEELQAHTPDHLSESLREAERTRTEAERTRVMSEASIETSKHQLKILSDRVADLERQTELQQHTVSKIKKRHIRTRGIDQKLRRRVGGSEGQSIPVRRGAEITQ